jgi:hypothetical protein
MDVMSLPELVVWILFMGILWIPIVLGVCAYRLVKGRWPEWW